MGCLYPDISSANASTCDTERKSFVEYTLNWTNEPVFFSRPNQVNLQKLLRLLLDRIRI